ncbi:hypothetical protein [Mangrovibacterium diazotrophicum]|uniref:Uncharacterized protein n=1 Tax=Mangrovibacterium diazotrophicum TaxID=1261403 RepID=A0A419VUE6_9BACT|nr:hypothetical protein [Mangrovibacterium diazotrophicum]RKD85082.1 hypothetical protein BC643_4601 [Mangrovibacterium diazotrophicum]
METEKQTTQGYFTAIRIVHLALMGGIVFFSAISYVLQLNGFESSSDEEFNRFLAPVVGVFVIGAAFASQIVFKQRLKECVSKPSLQEKLMLYRAALILKFALIEGPSFMAVVAYLLTGNLLYLGVVGLLLILFLIYRPSKEQTILDLELNMNDRRLLDDPDTRIGADL